MCLRFGLFVVVILARAAAIVVAQTETPRLRVRVAVADGYLTVGELIDDARLLRRLKPAEAKARQSVVADLNASFRMPGRIHCGSYLSEDPCPEDAELGHFNGSWAGYSGKFANWQAVDPVLRQRSLCEIFTPAVHLRLLAGVSAVTGLVWGDEEQLDTPCVNGELKFQVAPPVRPWMACVAPCAGADSNHDYVAFKDTGPHKAGRADFLAALAPLEGRLWRAPEIQERLKGLYAEADGYGDVVIEAPDTSSDIRVVFVTEGSRVSSVSGPGDDRDSLKALYYLLPDRDFRSLGTAREISYPEDGRPLLSAGHLSAAARMSALGFALDTIPDQGGANTFALQVRRLSAPARDDSRTPPLTGAHGALSDSLFIGGGLDYRPGQGVRGGPRIRVLRAGGRLRSLSASGGGGSAGGSGSLDYSTDFVGFGIGNWRRKLSLNLSGETQADARRFILGSNADERRWSAAAGATLELFRDRNGRWLRTFLEARRTTVTLLRAMRPDEKTKLATLDAGALYFIQGVSLRFERRFTLSPRIHAGVPVFAGTTRFAVGSVTSEFVQSFPRRYQAHVYTGAWFADGRTPVVELPSFGGADVVRGFRTDEAIGRRMWSLRGELWIPLPERFGAKGGLLKYLRETVKASPLVDAGGLYRAVSGRPGARVGAGGGLRVKVQKGVFLKLDYALGFYAAPGMPRGRFYFGVNVDPR